MKRRKGREHTIVPRPLRVVLHFPLIRSPFDALLALLALPVDARLRDAVFDAPLAGPGLVAAFAGVGAVRALVRFRRMLISTDVIGKA